MEKMDRPAVMYVVPVKMKYPSLAPRRCRKLVSTALSDATRGLIDATGLLIIYPPQ
jgi:hypothetical protein